jgi:hypothetical protein
MNGNIPMMSELLADNIDPVNLSTEYGVVYKRATFKFRTGDCLDLIHRYLPYQCCHRKTKNRMMLVLQMPRKKNWMAKLDL